MELCGEVVGPEWGDESEVLTDVLTAWTSTGLRSVEAQVWSQGSTGPVFASIGTRMHSSVCGPQSPASTEVGPSLYARENAHQLDHSIRAAAPPRRTEGLMAPSLRMPRALALGLSAVL